MTGDRISVPLVLTSDTETHHKPAPAAAIGAGCRRTQIMESIAEADADIAAGRTYGEDEIRAEFGVPRRPS
jgi:hypothetical protein